MLLSPLPALDRVPTRLRVGVRRVGLPDDSDTSSLEPEPELEPAPLVTTCAGSRSLSGAWAAAGVGAESVGAESVDSEAVRRVGARRRVAVRVLGLRVVAVLRLTVLRPLPVSEPVDSSGVSASMTGAGAAAAARPEPEPARGDRVRRDGTAVVALRRRSDQSPVK